jgi:hypothetical protein
MERYAQMRFAPERFTDARSPTYGLTALKPSAHVNEAALPLLSG